MRLHSPRTSPLGVNSCEHPSDLNHGVLRYEVNGETPGRLNAGMYRIECERVPLAQ
jgi:hypothetical protein